MVYVYHSNHIDESVIFSLVNRLFPSTNPTFNKQYSRPAPLFSGVRAILIPTIEKPFHRIRPQFHGDWVGFNVKNCIDWIHIGDSPSCWVSKSRVGWVWFPYRRVHTIPNYNSYIVSPVSPLFLNNESMIILQCDLIMAFHRMIHELLRWGNASTVFAD